MKNKILAVTGGAGFLGSHLCCNLMEEEIEKLIIIDDFSIGKKRNIISIVNCASVFVYKVDASDYILMNKLFEIESIDVVYNMAVVPLPASLKSPKKVIDINTQITSTLCELQRKGKYETLIHTSSSEAYGTSIYKNKPMDENHPAFPETPYAASKLASDHIALSYHRTFGLDIAIVRPFNMYGPRQNDGSYAAVIPITIKRILSGESPIIHGDGLQTRDFSYVEDIAEAIPNIYSEKSTRGIVVNLASGKEICIKNLIHLIMELMNYNGNVIYTDPRLGDVRRHRGDISLAKKLIGYYPKTDFREGLIKTIDWYQGLK